MNYRRSLLAALMATSFILNAENQIQDLSRKVLNKVIPAAKTAGHVAKTSSYATATGVTGAVTIIPAVLLAYVLSGYADGAFVLPGASAKGRTEGLVFRHDVDNDFAELVLGNFATGVWISLLSSSIYGMGKLTKHFAQKTKEAAKEVGS
jgi:hypothetical protein